MTWLALASFIVILSWGVSAQNLAPSLSEGSIHFPDDPLAIKQWHLAQIGAPSAWKITQGDPRVIVAIIDEGLLPNTGEFDGRILAPFNFRDGNSEVGFDYDRHGFRVTSTLGAEGNNKIKGAGVDWNCSIIPLKITDSTEFFADVGERVAMALDYAVENDARVVNLSVVLGLGEPVGGALRRAIGKRTTIVTGSGNSGGEVVNQIGYLPGVIMVGATDELDRRAGFSGGGRSLDLVAPGVNIWCWDVFSGDIALSGTSLAAAQVSGAVSLLLSVRSDLDPDAIRGLLLVGTDDIGEPGWDSETGWGRLNIANSLQLANCELKIVRDDIGEILRWRSPSDCRERVLYKVHILKAFKFRTFIS